VKPRKLRLARVEKGTPLAHLIAAHRQFRPKGLLPNNLGDGFLCALHPVYRVIRAEAWKRKTRFRERGAEEYFAYPLMALDDAIDARSIPYRPNFRWLEILERRAPGEFTLPDLKKGELQFNYLFHESAHLIAHDELFGRPVRLCPKNSRTLLGIMIGEAFANMVECISSAFAEGEIGSFFLDANCHFRANESEVRTLLRAAERYGWPAAAKVLLAAFLHSNYLVERLSEAETRRIARFAGLPENASIGRLAKIGLGLNEKFRTVTTPLHLRKVGFSPRQLERFLREDPLRRLNAPGSRALREASLRLAELAVRGV
jgi:hypothetical protein